MSSKNVKSIFSFAENIYGMGKKMLEESLIETNHDSDITQNSLNENSSIFAESPSIIANSSPQSSKDINVTDISKVNFLHMCESLHNANTCLSAVEHFIKQSKLNNTTFLKNQIRSIIQEIADMEQKVHRAEAESRHYKEMLENIKMNNEKTSDSMFSEELRQGLQKKISILEANINILKHEHSEVTNKYLLLQKQNNTDKINLDEKIYEIKAMKNQIACLNKKIDDQKFNLDSLNDQLHSLKNNSLSSSSQSDLERLRLHLVEVEENYCKQIKSLEESKQTLTNSVQNLSLELNRSKLNLQETRTNSEKQIKILNDQLNISNNERESLVLQVVNLSKSTQSQENTINILQNTLNDSQRDFESQLSLLCENHQFEVYQIQKDNQAALDSLKESIVLDIKKTHLREIDNLNKQIADLECKISSKNHEVSEISPVSTPYETLTNDILMKNLLIAYIHLPDEHKSFVFKLICSIAGIEPQDIKHDSRGGVVRTALSWVPIVNRFVAPPPSSSTPAGPSLAQLFMEYLEEESKKASTYDPYLPPIATDELKGIIERHNKPNS